MVGGEGSEFAVVGSLKDGCRAEAQGRGGRAEEGKSQGRLSRRGAGKSVGA